MEYDKATDTWIEKNITPHVQQIDKDIAEIYSNIKSTNDLYIKLNNLLQRTRAMISDIQNA
jgi:peptidoglycan hydrolase CwlO-like protein